MIEAKASARTVAGLHVLRVRQVDDHLRRGVLHLHLLHDGGAVVGDDDVVRRGHDHLVLQGDTFSISPGFLGA
eukprot:SAG31_NODE_441_length_15661_cov_17.905423_16_plen_73_part_00